MVADQATAITPFEVYTASQMAASEIVLTSSAFGRVLIDQLTTMPSKQSIMDESLPAGSWSSVMSVSYFSFGETKLVMVFFRRGGLSGMA